MDTDISHRPLMLHLRDSFREAPSGARKNIVLNLGEVS